MQASFTLPRLIAIPLIIIGIIFVGVGLLLSYAPSLINWFGKLLGSAEIRHYSTFLPKNAALYTSEALMHTYFTPFHVSEGSLHACFTVFHVSEAPLHTGFTAFHVPEAPMHTYFTAFHTSEGSIHTCFTPLHTSEALITIGFAAVYSLYYVWQSGFNH
ncbi:MAG: hypothetical protein D0528_02395 [Methylococcales bacterium]|nr:MAG: hypothetical protein D0528_02395 [Methylococcales bacterium]